MSESEFRFLLRIKKELRSAEDLYIKTDTIHHYRFVEGMVDGAIGIYIQHYKRLQDQDNRLK